MLQHSPQSTKGTSKEMSGDAVEYAIFAATPSEPVDFTVSDVNKRGATLRWSAPNQDGGSPVQGYVVEKRTPYSSRSVIHFKTQGMVGAGRYY